MAEEEPEKKKKQPPPDEKMERHKKTERLIKALRRSLTLKRLNLPLDTQNPDDGNDASHGGNNSDSVRFVTVSQDRTIRIWNLRTHSCVQIVSALDSVTASPVTRLHFNPNLRTFILASRRLMFWNRIDTPTSSTISHRAPLLPALYSAPFDEISHSRSVGRCECMVSSNRILSIWIHTYS